MAGTDHAEVAVVECSDFLLIQALSDGDYRRVNQTNIRIRIGCANLTDTQVVLRPEILYEIGTVRDVAKEGRMNEGTQVSPDQVVDFDEDRRGDYPGLGGTQD